MNKLIAIALAGALLSVLSVSSAEAQVNIDVGGGASGSAGGSGASANADASVDASIDTDENDTTVSDDETDTSDTNISVSVSKDDAASASLDAESAERSAASVSTSNDLSVYATSVMKRDANIEKVDATSDRIAVKYRKAARFLGFIPGSITATAEVHADGTVDIDYPWYRFLFAVEGSSDAEADLQAQVEEIMANANGTLTARVEAELLDAMHASLAGSAAATAGSATTADMAGPGDADVSNETDASGDASGEASGEVYPQ